MRLTNKRIAELEVELRELSRLTDVVVDMQNAYRSSEKPMLQYMNLSHQFDFHSQKTMNDAILDLRDLRTVAKKIVEAYRNKPSHYALALIMEELAPLVEDGGGR